MTKNKEEYLTWVNLIEAGEHVAIRRDKWLFDKFVDNYEILTVTKITPTQIVAKKNNGKEVRFYKKDGAIVGDCFERLIQIDEKIKADLQLTRARRKLHKLGEAFNKVAKDKSLAEIQELTLAIEKFIGETDTDVSKNI